MIKRSNRIDEVFYCKVCNKLITQHSVFERLHNICLSESSNSRKNITSVKIHTDLDCPICGNPIYENMDIFSKRKKYRCKSCVIIFPNNAIAKIKRKMEIRKKWIELSQT